MNTFKHKRFCHVLCIFILLIFQLDNTAYAELTSGDKLPAALKDIKAAGGVCRRDDPTSSFKATDVGQTIQPDFGCAISVNEVRAQMTDPHVMLVDLRSTAAHQAFHIENSLNIDLAALQSKPYWRDKALILIGDGKLDEDLYTSCTRLKQAGYKQVHVLKGGMLAWLIQNQAVIGRPISPQQQARLSDREFWQETQRDNVFLVLSKEQSAFQTEFPLSVMLPQVNTEMLRVAVERRRKAAKTPKLMSVILIANPGISDEQIRSLQQLVSPETLLVYSEGREAYLRQVIIQKAIWSAQDRGPKQPRCGS